jgi:ligand-binding SRPBCC domain-containing protein
MKNFVFQSELWLPAPRDRVFKFFADASNLETLTPKWLRFEIVTPLPIAMRAGALIDYRLKVHGFPIRWRTEITRWNPPHDFEDVQLRGPYALWQHTHTFAERDNGTVCHDHVRYRPVGGALINTLFVRRDIERIFQFRKQRLLEIFNKPNIDAT